MNETKFDGMGGIYAKFRPTYAHAFIEYLCSDVGLNKESTVADIGSGTGILTKQLIQISKNVFGVEPNRDMRAVAENYLGDFENFFSVNGTAENTTLCANSFDFITVAQAFHWFDRAKFKAECIRILKSNGKVILVWNRRDSNAASVKDCDSVNEKYCPNFKGFSGGMRGEEYENDFRDFFMGEYKTKNFQNNLSFDLEGFIGRTLSASYALKENDDNYPSYISELTECFYKHAVGGQMIMPNFTRCYIGTVKER